ncbi:MAG: helix-turn-helix domain-containing protein [Bacteroidota bacterium]
MERIEQMFSELMEAVRGSHQDELLTTNEVFDKLKISRNTFDKLVSTGELTAYRIGNKIYCKESEVFQMVERNRIAA